MYSLHILDNEQLSNAIIKAIKFNLDSDFIIFLKNEAMRRLMYSQHDDSFGKTLQNALEVIHFKKELELLTIEHSRCKEPLIQDQIYNDICLIESVIELATRNI